MNIHEYQAKEIFRKYDIKVPNGKVAYSVDEARRNAIELDGDIWVIKAQIHAGGRGLGGGVKIAKTLEEVEEYSKQILNMNLITEQTGKGGKIVHKLYIEDGVDIQDEFYIGITLDRAKEMPVIIASTKGGMEIEKIALSSPEDIVKIEIDPTIGIQSFHTRVLAFALNLSQQEQKKFMKIVDSLYTIYKQKDAQIIEINPLVKTKDGDFVALDGKIGFDDSALYRHPDIEEMRDVLEENEDEREASKYGLNYVALDGDIGCMVNGAGLAMGTMDAISHIGGRAANFLDVGGKADAKAVAKGFEIILRNKDIKTIFVNIFGGIVRCDRIANGILEATKLIDVKVPLVVRLDGTNAKEAIEILKNSNISNIITANDLSDGAIKATNASKGNL